VTGDPLASDGAHGPVAALGRQSKLLVGSYCAISFLRGQLINHDTQPAPAENQSNPIAPGAPNVETSTVGKLHFIGLTPADNHQFQRV
jgi:hypothetical protein